MGLFGTIKKAFKISEMKADQALDDSLNPIDKAKLNIKEKNDKLISAKKSLTKASEGSYIEINKLKKLENQLIELNGKKDKVIVAMKGFQSKGMSADDIKAKVGKVFENIGKEIQDTTLLIEPQTVIVGKHKKTVEQFKEMIKIFEKEILKDTNEVKLLESEYNMADTSSAIADAMNELNSDGSNDAIAQLRAKKDAKTAKAEAAMDTIMMGKEDDMDLDSLLLESSTGSPSSELDDILGLGAPTETPKLT